MYDRGTERGVLDAGRKRKEVRKEVEKRGRKGLAAVGRERSSVRGGKEGCRC